MGYDIESLVSVLHHFREMSVVENARDPPNPSVAFLFEIFVDQTSLNGLLENSCAVRGLCKSLGGWGRRVTRPLRRGKRAKHQDSFSPCFPDTLAPVPGGLL